jgi:hypothetical protein
VPKGVEVVVENGFATIDFVDAGQRAKGLNALLAVTPPELIETLTRSGPRRRYRIPSGNAAEAGLLDKRSKVAALEAGDSGFAEALRIAGGKP